MISALDLLKFRLSRGGIAPGEAMTMRPPADTGPGLLAPQTEADRRLQAMGPVPPSYLPEQVWDSILNKPTYGEGQVIPRPPNPLMEQEHAAGAFFGPQREDALRQDLGDVSRLKQEELPLSEGDWLTTRPVGRSPYASPLNQMMQMGRRAPLAMY